MRLRISLSVTNDSLRTSRNLGSLRDRRDLRFQVQGDILGTDSALSLPMRYGKARKSITRSLRGKENPLRADVRKRNFVLPLLGL
jgi:hypothetical protein